jgi:alkanesulfonate monooxygenase SsuD/methylene tetrahydromethanopterin reductase-like flavin-dependent oxidoreductase (luciferase family)
MKSLFFHLMAYGGLPLDFEQNYESVWVDIDSRLFNPRIARENFHTYLDELRFADELGYDGICVNEHHFNGYALMCSPQMMATVLARETRHAAITVMGCSIALYDPPMRVAEEMATLDVMSGGRLIAGFPMGTPMDTAYAYGQNPSSVRQKYREAHEIIIGCWENPDKWAFNGEYYKFAHINPFIKPEQKPLPPIWIPGGGSVETWRFAAENNYAYLYTNFYGVAHAEAQLKGWWKICQELGSEINPFRCGVIQFVGVAESREEAIEIYRPAAEQFYNANMKFSPRWTSPPGYVSEETKRLAIKSTTAEAAMRAAKQGGLTDKEKQEIKDARKALFDLSVRPRVTMEEIVEKGYIVVGSPDEVAEQIRNAAIQLNLGNYMALPVYGNMDHQTAMYNTEMYGKYVKPQLDELFANEFEHKWWPSTVGIKPPPDPKARPSRPDQARSVSSAM